MAAPAIALPPPNDGVQAAAQGLPWWQAPGQYQYILLPSSSRHCFIRAVSYSWLKPQMRNLT